jgi:uncharacterized Zn finger protein (UPF0148 family)
MSEFDKEAEREKLRQKYEDDAEDRQTTEHMSELLLQGATMTNKHCNNCGDPLFRQNGQEFCPTCQQAADQDVANRTAQVEAETAEGQTQADTARTNAHDQRAERTDAAPATGAQSQQPAGTGQPNETPDEPSRTRQQTDSTATNQHETAPSTGSLPEAEAALADAVTQLARQAAQESDPRQAKEQLAAAREAAEALDALQR